jgi:phage terminase large subunit-like protein
MRSATPDPLALAADLLDPPAWEPRGRPPLEPHQQPPDGAWRLWLLEAGRGSGKTEAAARYFASYMRANPGHRGRIIAPTFGDAVEACISGPSGLKSIDPDVRWLPSAPGGAKVIWPNGSEALVLGTPFPRDVDRLRAGGNRHLDWYEEMAANAQLADAWDQAQLGLRLGDHPHSIASTTPRTTQDYRKIRDLPGTAFTRASLFDNPHLPREFVDAMRARYEGTRLGRQELHGELIEDVDGALWTRAMFDSGRLHEEPEDVLKRLSTIVVAIDPAATSTPDADDTGIIVAGVGNCTCQGRPEQHAFVLADRTCHLAPEGWGQRAVRAYRNYDADRIVAEVNNGGEMVEHVIRTVDKNVPYRAVHASRGKQIRAEPVAALFGAPPKRPPRVHVVGSFPELEDQCCLWVPGEEDSPDRLDALVWAITDLMLGPQSGWANIHALRKVAAAR